MKNKYMIMAMGISILLCGIWFVLYGRKRRSALKAVTVAVMVAAATAGRIIFALTQGFKPVTAFVIISGANLGIGAGFMTGALTAALSDMYFGQGPWTPFQMAVWGIIGILSGILGKYIRKSKLFMMIYGGAMGVMYSVLMDVFTLFSSGEEITFAKYAVFVAASMPMMVVYTVSNIFFLAILGDFIGRKLSRIKRKYFL